MKIWIVCAALLSLSALSCMESPVGVTAVPAAREFAESLRNAPLPLAYARWNGRTARDPNEGTFTLSVTSESTAIGYDGCNAFSFGFEIEGDSLILTSLTGWEMGFTLDGFPYQDLSGRWRFTKTPDLLTLEQGETMLQFRCDFAAPLTETAMVNKLWYLSSSNDSLFAYFESMQFFTYLRLGDDRTFTAGSVHDDAYEYISGHYGINRTGGILFWTEVPRFGRGLPMGPDVYSQDLMLRILGCDAFRANVGSAVLTNAAAGRGALVQSSTMHTCFAISARKVLSGPALAARASSTASEI